MTRSIFGWSYPPGCNGPPDDYEGPCEVCGEPIDNCICPECPECGSVGDPYCYIHHGMRRTEEQKFSKEVSYRELHEWFIQNKKYEAELEELLNDGYWSE